MKKIVITIMVLMALPTFADYTKWEIARPMLNASESAPCQGWFDQAYVEYSVSEDKKTMNINLHDQFVRAGFGPTRLYNNNGGTWGRDIDQVVSAKLLKRVFALTSGLVIDPQMANLPYFMKPNFQLLDDFLEDVFISDVAEKLKQTFPDVTVINFRTNEQRHPYKIGHLIVDKSFQDWRKAFNKILLTFDITDITYLIEEEKGQDEEESQEGEDSEHKDKEGRGQ